jgi:hypothetical protein
MMNLKLCLICLLSLVSCQAFAVSVKQALELAVADNSSVHEEVLDDMLADLLHRELPIQGPIILHMTRIKDFNQTGCAREQIRFKVHMRPTDSQTDQVGYLPGEIEANMCIDGSAPKEGIDPQAPKKMDTFIKKIHDDEVREKVKNHEITLHQYRGPTGN